MDRFIYTCVGVLLLTAAGLKIAALSGAREPTLDPGPVSSPLVQGLAILWELLLGVWLLAGAQRRFAGYAAVLTFAIFAGIALRLGFQERPSCGCLGAITVNPWWMAGLDLAVVAALILFRPPPSPVQAAAALRSNLARMLAVPVVVVAVVGVTVGVLHATGGLSATGGSASAVEVQLMTDAGTLRAGEKKLVRVNARNRGDRPVRIVAGTSDCTCVATGDLPAEIAAGGSVQITVRIEGVGDGQFARKVVYVTDEDPPARLMGMIVGETVRD